MKTKLTLHLLLLSVLLMTACGNSITSIPAEAFIPTAVPPTLIPPTIVETPTFIIPPPTPLPTELVAAVLTPDAVQIQRWMEYEDALAEALFNSFYLPEDVVCEWVILGQSDQEVYVSAYCANTYSGGPSQAWIPSVIYLRPDGSVQDAEIPGAGSSYGPDIRRMFPPEVTDVIFSHAALTDSRAMADRMRWRRGHPDEPPLVVLPFLQVQPTPPVIPWVKPDPSQVEKWKDYQTVLARTLDYRPPEEVICEWEFLGRIESEVAVWAVCGSIHERREGLEGLVRLAVVDGNVLEARQSDDPKDYPPVVMERYYGGLIHFQQLVDHLRWRQSYPDEPPLVVIYADSTP